MTTDQNAQESLWKLIRDIRFGMLTSQAASGELRSHPLTTQNPKDEQGSVLWFFISAGSEIARDVQSRPEVNVAYASPSDDSYVSVSGRARIVDDAAKKQALWSTMTQACFPGGPNDPGVALLGIDITNAEYWDVDSSKMVQLFKMAKAAVTGETPKDMGKHAEVNLR